MWNSQMHEWNSKSMQWAGSCIHIYTPLATCTNDVDVINYVYYTLVRPIKNLYRSEVGESCFTLLYKSIGHVSHMTAA